jgi:hypothetical protein
MKADKCHLPAKRTCIDLRFTERKGLRCTILTFNISLHRFR